jgi:hypothetical protein
VSERLAALAWTDFAACLKQRFRVPLGDAGQALELELVGADPLGSGDPAPGRRRPFSLIFRGPPAPVLPQRIYRLENAAMGALEIFLVPIGPDAAGLRYEAIFS